MIRSTTASDSVRILLAAALLGGALPAQGPRQGVVDNVAESLFGGAPNDAGENVAVSANGRYVAFDSYADNLVPGDSAEWSDVFVRDTVTGAVVRVSRGVGGAEANEDSFLGDISNDGMVVVFHSCASNLATPSSTLGRANVYLADLNPWAASGALPGLSRLTNGDSDSYWPSIGVGPGGVRVCFLSDATNLVAGDTNGRTDVFVKTIGSVSVTKRVNLRHNGAQTAAGDAGEAKISSDGLSVLYTSDATNLVSGFTPTGTFALAYFIDVAGAFGAGWTPQPICVSRTPSGGEPDGDAWSPAVGTISGHIVFCSDATDLIAGDTNGCADVFFKNVAGNGPLIRMNVDPLGNEVGSPFDAGAIWADLSDNGNPVVLYVTDSAGIVADDQDVEFDAFIRHFYVAASIEIGDSARRALDLGVDAGTIPAISGDGLTCVFFSPDLALPTNDDPDSNGPFRCALDRTLSLQTGLVAPGATVSLRIASSQDAGRVYVLLAAGSADVGIPLSGIRYFPLDFDALLAYTFSPQPLWNAVGVVGGAGIVDHSITIPPIPGLSGFLFYAAAATLDGAMPDGVRGVTNALPLPIQ